MNIGLGLEKENEEWFVVVADVPRGALVNLKDVSELVITNPFLDILDVQ